jgi:homoserine O-acetyltransferase
MEFPAYNIRDMIQAEHKVLTEGLGIEHLVAVAGISSGATKSLQFAVSYPEFVDGVIPIVGGALDSTEGFLFGLQIESRIETCEGWQAGNYEVNPRECAAATLWPLFHTLYSREWWNGNIRTREAFQRWSEYWYSTYVGVQDARDLYLHSKALGRAGLADTPGFNGDLMAVLKSIRAKTLFVVSSADTWVPPEGVEIQRKAIPGSRVAAIDSSAGHMICCGEDAEATWLLIWNDLSRRTSRGLVRGPSTSRGRRRAQLAAARVAGPGTRLTVDARDMAHTRPGLKRHRRRLITLIFADRALSSPSWS